MQDNEKKPALRFKGFTDPWEQRKLGELIRNISTGKSVNSDEGSVETGDIGVLKTSCVSYDRFNPSESKPVVKSEQGLVRCFAEKDSVIVSRMNTPERVGACGYVSKDFPNLFLPDRLWKLKFQDDVDAYFVYMMLVSGAYKEKITAMASGTSGSMYNIPKDTFLNLQLEISSKINEQKKIGRLLRNLDTLITLHQRKYEKLVNIKKSMLDKMFPKNGASVPEIRFKGFTDPWEQRKLGEIANFSKGVGYSKNDLCEEGTPIILYGRLYTKYETCIFDVDTFVKEKAGSVYSKGGEVIVPASGETAEDISIASVVVKPGILLGGDLNIVSPTAEYDSAFLALTISSGAAHEYLSSLAQGKSVVHLHNSDIQSVSAKFPTKREQEKIHLLFGKIDTLITLHQRKLEKLQNIKKSCLEKMFV
jgi:type I restriction enzyme S subunit